MAEHLRGGQDRRGKRGDRSGNHGQSARGSRFHRLGPAPSPPPAGLGSSPISCFRHRRGAREGRGARDDTEKSSGTGCWGALTSWILRFGEIWGVGTVAVQGGLLLSSSADGMGGMDGLSLCCAAPLRWITERRRGRRRHSIVRLHRATNMAEEPGRASVDSLGSPFSRVCHWPNPGGVPRRSSGGVVSMIAESCAHQKNQPISTRAG